MKGIILAGGSGTRLHPITMATSKQLVPVYDKPMIYYPLSVLMLSGITEILIITTPWDQDSFKRLLGDGSHLGCSFEYATQEAPNGLAEAFLIGENFIGNDSVALILGDNIFYGAGLGRMLQKNKDPEGAVIFAYKVSDPARYGVVTFNSDKQVTSIEEKPQNPKSSYAVPGLYFYDNEVISIAKGIKPSARGELEITDINKVYLAKNALRVDIMDRGTAWLDTGTFRSLMNANMFVQSIEERQGLKIGCIEEAAWEMGYINTNQLRELADRYKKSGYGEYLLRISEPE